ncbi:hypothetical protein [Pseudomonas paracarnis]|uniref:hypothetical protein n=1 Tax=Pseudomonas paracarnis TaxID=2750625 RepID=UPI003917F3B4
MRAECVGATFIGFELIQVSTLPKHQVGAYLVSRQAAGLVVTGTLANLLELLEGFTVFNTESSGAGFAARELIQTGLLPCSQISFDPGARKARVK